MRVFRFNFTVYGKPFRRRARQNVAIQIVYQAGLKANAD